VALVEGLVLYTWGRNQCGQLGSGRQKDIYEPHRLQGMVDVGCIAAGEDHSAAVLNSGELFTWGSAESGKLGHGSSLVWDNDYIINHDRIYKFRILFTELVAT
jgi:alpha-tubulin suppressor-like RCC1 family protein